MMPAALAHTLIAWGRAALVLAMLFIAVGALMGLIDGHRARKADQSYRERDFWRRVRSDPRRGA